MTYLTKYAAPALPDQQIKDLVKQSRQGDKSATEKIIRHNLNAVFKIARKVAVDLPLEDKVQEGVIGLVHAIKKFNLNAGVKFITYATYWIYKKIQLYWTDNKFTVRIPRHLYNLDYKVRNNKEIVSPEKQKELNLLMKPARSLDELIGKKKTVNDLIIESNWKDYQLEIVNRICLKDRLSILSEEERLIVFKNFIEEKSVRSIAEELSKNRGHIERTLKKTITKLKQGIKNETIRN